MKLYPIKFYPIYKEKIWGGNLIKERLNRNDVPFKNTGESFEISCFGDEISTIRNGEFENMTLDKLLKMYPEEILGKYIIEKHGKDTFPLLIKYIDAKADLSIQVHPNKENTISMSKGREKNEFWYVLDSNEGKLNIGFNKNIDKDEIRRRAIDGSLKEVLDYRSVTKGDSFFIGAGTVHAICSGAFIVEIQQSSDTTYRLYDYDRIGKDGNKRELHLDDALECLNTNYGFDKASYKEKINSENGIDTLSLTDNPYFKVKKININDPNVSLNIGNKSSFTVIILLSGDLEIFFHDESLKVNKGELVLIPAGLDCCNVKGKCEMLETYI